MSACKPATSPTPLVANTILSAALTPPPNSDGRPSPSTSMSVDHNFAPLVASNAETRASVSIINSRPPLTTGDAARRARGVAPAILAVQALVRLCPSVKCPGAFAALPPGCGQSVFVTDSGRSTDTPASAGSASVSRSVPNMSTRLPIVGVLFFLPESPRTPSSTAHPPSIVEAASINKIFEVVFTNYSPAAAVAAFVAALRFSST